MTVHVVRIGLFTVDQNGNRIDKSGPAATINDLRATSQDFLVIPEPGIPNSSGYPTVKAYLQAESAGGYSLRHLDQSIIITAVGGGGGGGGGSPGAQGLVGDRQVAVHVARLGYFSVDKNGNRVDKSHGSASINDLLAVTKDFLVIPDPDISSSAGYPTIKQYIAAEAAAGFQFKHIDQTFVVTESS